MASVNLPLRERAGRLAPSLVAAGLVVAAWHVVASLFFTARELPTPLGVAPPRSSTACSRAAGPGEHGPRTDRGATGQ